jgi:hypothetical protein
MISTAKTLCLLMVYGWACAESIGAPGEAFTVVTNFPDRAYDFNGLAWADYDNDEDLDLLVVRDFNAGSVFRNDGTNGFVRGITGLRAVARAAVAWGDYDNDAFVDLIIGGYPYDAGGPPPTLYRNVNGTSFLQVVSSFKWNDYGSLAWGDPDKDGDLDLLLAGTDIAFAPTTVLYRNERTTFRERPAGLTPVRSLGAWLDYDGDGWIDILLAGATNSSPDSPSLSLYRNNHAGGFEKVESGLPQTGLRHSVAICDFDGDGDPDLAISDETTRVYRNVAGMFERLDQSFPSVGYKGSVTWADYDNDGRPDLAVAVNTTLSINTNDFVYLFRNTGSGFENGPVITFPRPHTAIWGDYDNDGDLDLVVQNLGQTTTLFRNNATTANQRPAPPSSLGALVSSNDVVLSWVAGSDRETPSTGLTYNVRVGRTPGGNEVVSCHSSPAGFRRLPEAGNAGSRLDKLVRNLARGTYHWSVQSVDSGSAGSAFAPEATFTVTNALLPNFDPLPNLTLTEDGPVAGILLTNIFIGEVQSLTFTVETSNPGLLTNLTASYAWLQPTGHIAFKLVTNAFGSTTVSVIASGLALDGGLISFTRSFLVTVNPVNNDPPVAIPQSVELVEDTSIELELGGYDPDGDPITSYSIWIPPGYGTVSGTPPLVRYTPRTNFFGGDFFYFAVSANNQTNYGRVLMNVLPVTDEGEFWLSIEHSTNGSIVTVHGEPYQVYWMEFSTRLTNWFSRGTTIDADLPNGISRWRFSLGGGRWYFRARSE